MKKYIIPTLAIAAMMVSCNNAAPKMDEQPASSEVSASGMKIAYVEVDSLMTQYNFAKDYTVTLEKKSNNARNTLTQKGNQLQAAVNNFQQKLNNNGFQSRERPLLCRTLSSVSRTTFSSCRHVWSLNSPTRRQSLTRLCAIHSTTS